MPVETPNTDATALPENPSIAELRIALAAEHSASAELVKAEAAPAVVEPEPITPEPKAEAVPETPETPAKDKTPESDPGTERTEPLEPVEDEPEIPEDDKPVELSRGAKKRIAIEVRRQNEIQRQIDEAVSRTKALKADLGKLTADTPGPEPAPTTESAVAPKDGKPLQPELVEPDLDSFTGTWEEHQAASKAARAAYKTAMAKYEGDLTEWLVERTRATVSDELAQREAQTQHRSEWQQAEGRHGKDFKAQIQPLVDHTSAAFQTKVSLLDNWSDVSVHLAAHLDELAALTGLFERNPDAAIIALGKLEVRLEQAANNPEPPKAVEPAKKVVKALPEPPPKVGGGASANVAIDLNSVDPGSPAWKREARRQLALKTDG